MDDFYIYFGMISSLSIGINLYLLKSITGLAERISHLEGLIHK